MPKVDYLMRRVARLSPMMALSLVIGFLPLYLQRGDYSGTELIWALAANFLFIPALFENNLMLDGHPVKGLIFPFNDPLWSIFFEMVASLAFIGLYRLRGGQLAVLAACSFVVVIAGAALRAHAAHYVGLDLGVGYNVETLLPGFPRVFYGFVLGMVIFHVVNKFSWPVHPLWLYVALLVMLTFPSHLHGLYSIIALGILAPSLVFLGAQAAGGGRFLLSVSELLGYLSYPIYCLHRPIFNAISLIAPHLPVQVPIKSVSIVATIAIAFTLAKMLDYFEVQRRLTRLTSAQIRVSG